MYICCVLLGRDNMMFQSCYKIKESVSGPKETRYSYGQKLLKYKISNCQQRCIVPSVTIFNNTIPLNGENRNLGKVNLMRILVSGLLVFWTHCFHSVVFIAYLSKGCLQFAFLDCSFLPFCCIFPSPSSMVSTR